MHFILIEHFKTVRIHKRKCFHFTKLHNVRHLAIFLVKTTRSRSRGERRWWWWWNALRCLNNCTRSTQRLVRLAAASGVCAAQITSCRGRHQILNVSHRVVSFKSSFFKFKLRIKIISKIKILHTK